MSISKELTFYVTESLRVHPGEQLNFFISLVSSMHHPFLQLSSDRSSHIFNQPQSLAPCLNLILQIGLKSFILPSQKFNSNLRRR